MTRLTLSALVLLWPATLSAQTACYPRAEAVVRLALLGQHRHVLMLGDDRSMIEVFGQKNGRWTILRTVAGQLSCIVATGDNFEPRREPLPMADAPA